MDAQENQTIYEKSRSIVLDLETLTKNYQNLLIEYQQAVLNYINYVKEAQSSDINSAQSMVTIKGTAYWGTEGITQNNSNSLNECKASCIKTDGCIGATFNSTDYEQPMCWLRSGISKVAAGKDGDYAIVNNAQYLLSIVEGLNEKLITINEKILTKQKDGQPLYDSNLQESQVQNSALVDKYKSLTADRDKISQLMNEYQTLDEQQNQGTIKINQNYYSYILLLGLAIVVIFILIKYTTSSGAIKTSVVQTTREVGINANYIVFGLIIIILIMNFLINKYYL